MTDPLSYKSTKTYNSFGGVLTSSDAANTNTQTTTYDANFNPATVTDLLNGAGTPVSSSTYDASGNVQTSTDSNGKTTEFGYDPNGNLIQATDALNEITHYAYDPMCRMVSQTDPLRNTTQFAYDALGRLQTKTDALHDQTQYTYDNNGNKTSETNPLGNTTSYQYDNMNRVTLITYPTSPATTRQFTYDFRGNKLTEVDQSGRTTKYVYDLAGQLISKTYAFGTADAGTIQYSYDLDGRVQTTTDELNNVTTNTYDAAGNLATVKDALTNVTTYGYDADNRRTSVQDANRNTTNYAYDARSRLKTVTYPIAPPATQATTTQYTYDGVGRVLTMTDQAGNVTTKTYDDIGRLTSVKDALATPNVTQYFYDLAGNLKTLTDANAHTTTYKYDSLNRRVMRTLPLQQFETATYDAAGNLLTKADFNGKTTSYEYDQVNRLRKKIPDPSLGQTTVVFTYNPTGTRATMVDASGTTTYSSYDNRDRLKTKATPEGTLNYTYDAHGNLLTILSSHTNGASLTYTYDALNRLSTVKDNLIAAQGGPSGPTTYSYDPAGNLAGYAYSNSVQIGNAFDPLNRLTQTCSATTAPACSASTKLASYVYTLGSAGNRLNVLELNSRNVAYGYDNDYRLASETITGDPTGNNGTVTYNAYDNVGNRTQTTSTLSAVPGGSFSYDGNDRLAIDTYDNNGNTVSSAGVTNTYDFENRMLTHGGVTLVYDGDGNRVSETIGGTTTKYLIDNLNPTGLPQVLDETVSGTLTRTYAYGLQRTSENQKVGSTWTPSFYGYDGHGNVRFLMNKTGTATDWYDYDAFGMPIRTSGTTANYYLYSAERLDSNIGLYDFRARYYNQATGRFWARDPQENKSCCSRCSGSCSLQSCSSFKSNSYAYADGDPVNRVDPTGREAFQEYITINEEDLEEYFIRRQLAIEECLFSCNIGCSLFYYEGDLVAFTICKNGCDAACHGLPN
jgi:RHS repeat-associated protein